MKLTRLKLKQLIKEEFTNLQKEGILDFFKGKKTESREKRLYRITKEDFMDSLRRDGAALYQTGENAGVRAKAEKEIQRLVDQMMDVEVSDFNLCNDRPCNPRNEGPRDGKWERRIRDLARQYSRQLK